MVVSNGVSRYKYSSISSRYCKLGTRLPSDPLRKKKLDKKCICVEDEDENNPIVLPYQKKMLQSSEHSRSLIRRYYIQDYRTTSWKYVDRGMGVVYKLQEDGCDDAKPR